MTLTGSATMDGNDGYASAPERGTRRRKLAKAANELRQWYQGSSGLAGQSDGGLDDDSSAIPGAFPGASVVRNGDEEMLIFPSYAIRHPEKKTRRRQEPGATQDIRSENGSRDAEYWRKEWDKYEKDTSIVEVDIRGWLYSPHRGPMTRKNRLLVGIARQLSGVPAPASSRASSPQSTHHARVEARNTRHEEELAEKEAESIKRKGEGEADTAWRGRYSEIPDRQTDSSTLHGLPNHSPSTMESAPALAKSIPLSAKSSQADFEAETKPLAKRSSWRQPSDMTSAELSVANAHLMVRLKPFLTTPLANLPLTAFFYNDHDSRSRTITTNEAGHFSLRAALDFIPTHVRVLASEKLSATEEVRITEAKGISMISDIDDTIKHSGIGSGAREIFRNAFIRNLSDLTIDGVREWYTTMADLGVNFHYVSNSPWQLYPVLMTYFAKAGLPKGSFHLKQYTGMLQGIFEPVAERKKGTLDRILADFPDRRFILAGDSGEADLELYTDVMLANPGRIIGVFIRDVTTTKPPPFFQAANRSHDILPPMRERPRPNGLNSSYKGSAEPTEKPPALPPRQPSNTTSTLNPKMNGPSMGKLIDLDDAPPQQGQRSVADPDMRDVGNKLSTSAIRSPPPSRPSKPPSLQSLGSDSQAVPPPSSLNSLHRKAAPPLPPKPHQYSHPQERSNLPIESSPLSNAQQTSSIDSRAPFLERQSYRATVRDTVASASNALYSLYNGATPSSQDQTPTSDPSPRQPPPVPPRRNISSYPAAAAQYATDRISEGWNGSDNNNHGNPEDNNGNDPLLSRKEEMWQRRWERARYIFAEKGVVLKSWRVGEDVADEAIRLIGKANKDMGK